MVKNYNFLFQIRTRMDESHADIPMFNECMFIYYIIKFTSDFLDWIYKPHTKTKPYKNMNMYAFCLQLLINWLECILFGLLFICLKSIINVFTTLKCGKTRKETENVRLKCEKVLKLRNICQWLSSVVILTWHNFKWTWWKLSFQLDRNPLD